MVIQTIKQTVKRIGWFLVSNIVSLVPYLIFLFIFIFALNSLIEKFSQNNIFNSIVFLSCSLAFGFTFYKYYFINSDEFKSFYYMQTKEGASKKDIIKRHVIQYGRIDVVWISVFALLIGILHKSIVNYITLLFASSAFFLEIIPIRILAAFVWVIYVAAVYFVCLLFYYKRLEKKKMHKSA